MIVCTRHILSGLSAETGLAKGAKTQVLPTANYQLPTTNCNEEGQCAVNYRTELSPKPKTNDTAKQPRSVTAFAKVSGIKTKKKNNY